MGGGTSKTGAARVVIYGLSPRGRGNPMAEVNQVETERSIPAWAGEPSTQDHTQRPDRVYPRVGGGTQRSLVYAQCRNGLSPRGRGNPHHRRFYGAMLRSIPAWAGEPCLAIISRYVIPVYPRVGGGTSVILAGQIPRPGLSPRGRGNQSPTTQSRSVHRSIPAWAGEPR